MSFHWGQVSAYELGEDPNIESAAASNLLFHRDKKSNPLSIAVDHLYTKYLSHLPYCSEMKSIHSTAKPHASKCSCVTTIEDISGYHVLAFPGKLLQQDNYNCRLKQGCCIGNSNSMSTVALSNVPRKRNAMLFQCIQLLPNGVHYKLKVYKNNKIQSGVWVEDQITINACFTYMNDQQDTQK